MDPRQWSGTLARVAASHSSKIGHIEDDQTSVDVEECFLFVGRVPRYFVAAATSQAQARTNIAVAAGPCLVGIHAPFRALIYSSQTLLHATAPTLSSLRPKKNAATAAERARLLILDHGRRSNLPPCPPS